MRRYFQYDAEGTVRGIATNPINLHRNNDWHLFYTDEDVCTGDHYDPETRRITRRPERYPGPLERDTAEQKIQAEIRAIAIGRLKQRGELPQDYDEV